MRMFVVERHLAEMIAIYTDRTTQVYTLGIHKTITFLLHCSRIQIL